jgi:hypothetical protein
MLEALHALTARLETGDAPGRQWRVFANAFEKAPREAWVAIADAAASEEGLDVGSRRIQEVLDQLGTSASSTGAEFSTPRLKLLTEWVEQAHGTRMAVPREHEKALAPSRTFALACLQALQAETTLVPRVSRATDVEAEPGKPRGPTIRLLDAIFAEVRAGLSTQAGYETAAGLPVLRPAPETLVEWVRAARGKSRRRRAPRMKAGGKKAK